jgi:hypothetical protein
VLLRRRSAVRPVIGYRKDDPAWTALTSPTRFGDTNNVVLAAADYNFRGLLGWLKISLSVALRILVLLDRRVCCYGPGWGGVILVHKVWGTTPLTCQRQILPILLYALQVADAMRRGAKRQRTAEAPEPSGPWRR